MLNRLCEMSINWIGMALGAALIVCGFVMTCSPFIMPTTAWETKDGAPCYCSLIQMSIVSLLFYTLGIKCVDRTLFQNLEDGALILNEVACLMYSLVLMSLVLSLLIFEVRACIGKLHRGNAK